VFLKVKFCQYQAYLLLVLPLPVANWGWQLLSGHSHSLKKKEKLVLHIRCYWPFRCFADFQGCETALRWEASFAALTWSWLQVHECWRASYAGFSGFI